ncbi:MAG: IS110 family transposase [candidate division NC10 bacterium]
MTSKPTRFCGIDIAKNKHVACVIDADNNVLVKKQSFLNTAQGFQQLLARLQQVGGPADILIGMEATGHYWYALHDFLVRCGYRVQVINPLQTRQGGNHIRKSKTDRIDAQYIAMVLKRGLGAPALVPSELGMTCRQLTRLRYALIRQSSQIKNLTWSRLQPVWPEYEGLFTDPFGPTSRALLAAAPTPADLLAMDPDRLGQLVRRASHGRFTQAKAADIIACAKDSAGMRRGLEGARVSIHTLLATLDALRPIRVKLEADIEALAARLPQYILTLPGANPIRAVSLYGETDPIDHFAMASQLVAFAGLDMVVYQTGQYEAPHRHISKRGSPVLRQTLWSMAHLAVREEGPLQDFFLRKRKAGLHHLAAVTATAVKLARIAWRILTDQRDYVPDGCPTKS